jgi:hypothetical protein
MMKGFCSVCLACILMVCLVYSHAQSIDTTIDERLNALEVASGIKSAPEKTSFNVFGDFLYWKASLDGVAWATTAEVVSSVSGGTTFDEYKTRTVHFEYAPAFQVGAGVGLPFDHWDLSVRWLRTFSTGKDHARGSLTESVGNRVIFDSIGLIQALTSSINKAKAKCHVHLDVVDLVLGRTFLWSKYFSFRPFAGIRGSWLRLDWDLSFTRPIQSNFPTAQTFTFVDIDNSFKAGGLVGGFESKWNLYKGLGLFSYATASLIYGESKETTKQEYFYVPALSSAVTKQNFTARNSAHTVKGVFDIAVGVKWETHFCKDYHLLLHAGYDFFYWPAVTQKTVTQNTRIRDRSDLSFEGLMIGARVDF